MISPISHQPNFTTFKHNDVDRWSSEIWTEFWQFYHKGSFFQKTQKLLTKFPALAISGRHNSATITDRPKFTTKLTLYGMSSFHFYHLEVFALGWTLRTGSPTPFFRDVRNYVSLSYRMDNADIIQSQAANHHRLLSHVALAIVEWRK